MEKTAIVPAATAVRPASPMAPSPADPVAATSPSAAAPPIGNVDVVSASEIIGWAWNPDQPGDAVTVEIGVEGDVFARIEARGYRPDVEAAGFGSGRYGFSIDRNGLPAETWRQLRVTRAFDSRELPGSPGSLSSLEMPTPEPQATPDASAGSAAAQIGNLDTLSAEEIAGWAWDPEHPERAVEVEILGNERVIATLRADVYRPDLEEFGAGDGRHGFSLPQIGSLLPDLYCQLHVRRAEDRVELPGSPRWFVNLGRGIEDSGGRLIEDLVTAAVGVTETPEQLEDLLAAFIKGARRLLEARRALATGPGPAAPGAFQALRADFPELPLAASDAPIATVIIPAHDQFRLTYQCIASIARHPPETPFEVLLVDDGSTDETALAGLLLPEALRIERLRRNSGFIAACNRGAQLAKGEFLLFLNNDTVVRPGWLDELVETFARTENIGIAGAQLLAEDGKIQDSGGIVWRSGDAWNWGRDADSEDPRFKYMRDADYVSGAALMIRRDLFLSLGGFDAYYAPAYYEDTDLAFRVRQAGKRVVVQPASRIVHLEGASSGKDPTGPGIKRYQTINRVKFYKRWQKVLLQHRPLGEEPVREAERAVTRRAYFIDDCVPTPDLDAGSNAALQHMLALVALGYRVTFLSADNMLRDDPYTAQLEKYGIECPHFPSCASVEQLFRENRPPPDLVYLHRFANAQKYAGMVRSYFPQSKIAYSVADLHFLRLERQAAVTGRPETLAESEAMRRRELPVMEDVDVVLSHSQFEVDLIRRLAPAVDVQALGWSVPLRELHTPIECRYGIAFVGGYQHQPNVDAAQYLVREIMPLIRAAGLPIGCFVGGSKMPREVCGLGEPDVEIVGFVPDLAALFDRVRCTVAPLRYGAGIKGKVLDSFAFGLPCVMTEIAAEGIDLPAGLVWLVARSLEEFADKVVALHRDDRLAAELSSAGRALIGERFGFAAVRDRLQQIIATARRAP